MSHKVTEAEPFSLRMYRQRGHVSLNPIIFVWTSLKGSQGAQGGYNGLGMVILTAAGLLGIAYKLHTIRFLYEFLRDHFKPLCLCKHLILTRMFFSWILELCDPLRCLFLECVIWHSSVRHQEKNSQCGFSTAAHIQSSTWQNVKNKMSKNKFGDNSIGK